MDRPLLDVLGSPSAGNNINGPSLIRVPDWITNPLGRYYLYFAHHEGSSIRLAYADQLQGPWTIHEAGALQLVDTPFPAEDLPRDSMIAPVLAAIDAGEDGNYAHIASPDCHVDRAERRIRMYYHGRIDDGTQATRVAFSTDGLHFETEPELLGDSYFRVFELAGWFYAIALGGWLYRSADGVSRFEKGPKLTDDKFRHCAIAQWPGEGAGANAESAVVLWSRAGDNPECILQSRLAMSGDWHDWRLSDTAVLHTPQRSWEGSDCEAVASRYGGIMTPARQLRDPAVFVENNESYLLYSVAGEQGIALGLLQTEEL